MAKPPGSVFPWSGGAFSFVFGRSLLPAGAACSPPVAGPTTMAPAALLREVTQVLCAAGGALELEELRRRVRPNVDCDVLDRLLRERGRFLVARRAAGAGAAAVERVVLAVSPLRLCSAHLGPKPGCAGLCAQLHLCKSLFYGKCKFLRDG